MEKMVLVIKNMSDLKRFLCYRKPDHKIIRISIKEFNEISRAVGFRYDTLINNKLDLVIRNSITSEARKFEKLHESSSYDTWECRDSLRPYNTIYLEITKG